VKVIEPNESCFYGYVGLKALTCLGERGLKQTGKGGAQAFLPVGAGHFIGGLQTNFRTLSGAEGVP